LAKGKHLSGVVHFGDAQVFAGATTYTCLLFLDKAGADVCRFMKVDDLETWQKTGQGIEGAIPAVNVTAAEWNFAVGRGADLFEKLRRMPVKLGDVADIFVGLQTSADDVFIMNVVEVNDDTIKLHSKALGGDWTFERGLLFPLVSGTDVQRYGELPERQYILFPYEASRTTVSFIEFSRLAERYPQTAIYLTANRKRLENREKGKFKDEQWYRFGRNQNIGIQNRVKLCVPRLVNRLYAAYDPEGLHFLDNVDVGGVVWQSTYQNQGFPYLLGILNSKLLRWCFPFVSAPFRGGWMSANRQFLSQLPIRPIDFADMADRERHERMVAMVEEMLALHQRLAAAKTDHEQTSLKRQIDAADRRIDRLVYDLYNLTEDEIRIVEKD